MEKPALYPKTLEEAAYSARFWSLLNDNDFVNSAIRRTTHVRYEVYRMATRDEHKLKMLIAMKKKEASQATDRGSVDVALCELDALERTLCFVRRFGGLDNGIARVA